MPTSTPSETIVKSGDEDAVRNVWRGMGSTVALVATEADGRRAAMLATAVTSVTMDPPSLLVCLNRSASAHDTIEARGCFSLGLLSATSRDLGIHLASAGGAARFQRGDWRRLDAPGETIDGLPWLGDAQSTLFCRIDRAIPYGTHTIFVATIEKVSDSGRRDPLLYCEGRWGGFDAERPAVAPVS